MGRGARFDRPGAWHHVMNRGSGRRCVFRSDGERRLFVSLLAEFDPRFSVEIHSYCLMGNHYHLLVRSGEGRLSEAMKWLGAEFTRAVNAWRGVDGPIFRGRFHSVAVERDAHHLWLIRYINANPIDIGWRGPLAAYPWSGLGALLGHGRTEPWLHADVVCRYFGDEPDRLERFVEAARSCDTATPCMPEPPGDADIEAAVRVAGGVGPTSTSASDARAAHTMIAVRLGIDLESMSTVSGLDRRAALLHVERSRKRASGSEDLGALIRRAESVLGIETTLYQTVSDTR